MLWVEDCQRKVKLHTTQKENGMPRRCTSFVEHNNSNIIDLLHTFYVSFDYEKTADKDLNAVITINEKAMKQVELEAVIDLVVFMCECVSMHNVNVSRTLCQSYLELGLIYVGFKPIRDQLKC